MKSRISIAAFLLCAVLSVSGQDLRVLSSSSKSITFQFTLSNFTIDSVQVNNRLYLKPDFLNSDFIPGQLKYHEPVRRFNIGVPSEFGNTLRVQKVERFELSGELIPAEVSPGDEMSGSDQVREDVTFPEFGYVRNLAVQTIDIHPVRFDSETGKIHIIKSIIFTVNYSPEKAGLVADVDARLLGMIENPGAAKNWGKASVRLKKVSSSVLSSGTWYRFTVNDEGIYRINRSQLSGYGIDPASVDPRTIKIYNNGGYVLSENVVASRPDDLVENAILVEGEADGSFDDGDYILFYARPTDFWEYNSTSDNIQRNKHWYDNKNFFWITSGGAQGKRMQSKSSLSGASSYNQDFTFSHAFHDDDNLNLHKSGKVYFGDELNSSRQTITYTTTLPQIIQSSKIKYNVQFANSSEKTIRLDVYENNSTVLSFNMGGVTTYVYGRVYNRDGSYTGTLPENRSVLKFAFNGTGPSDRGNLDFFEIEYKRRLYADGDQIILFSKDTTANIKYTLHNFSNSNINVFDISDFSNVKQITQTVISAGQVTFSAAEKANAISKYIGVNSSQFKTPGNGEAVENSDLHGIADGSEVIVISNKFFQNEVEAYVDYRENLSPNKKDVTLVYVDQIYNEFSGGLLDPTAIRDFIKYAYENWTNKPYFVVLYGDGDYDFLDKEGLGKNFIPTYQKAVPLSQLLYELQVYPTDDYFVQVAGGSGDHKIDLAIGRLNASTTEEAKLMNEKIANYENEADRGIWRNTITLVADDGWTSRGDDGSLHTGQSEDIARNYIPKTFNEKKIYLSAYPTVITGAGRRKPAVNKAIIDAVNNGTLILNFVGHGNPEVWTHERIFEKATTIPQLQNAQPFFLTAATCDFGLYDDPSTPSATEEMLFLNQHGLIAGFTASRPVYASPNHSLNKNLYKYLLVNKNASDLPNEIGMALFYAKQIISGENSEKFHILGDPTIRLNEPNLPVSIDKINNSGLSGAVQVNALSDLSLEGSVKKIDGTDFGGFSGEAIISVFDSERLFYLDDINYNMVLQGGLIFRGRATIDNGTFGTSFVVPKDISYENKNGKIVAYIFDDSYDGIGSTNQIIIGGSNSAAVNDNTGPEIEIYFDDLSYSGSYLVSPDFTLLVKLTDATGLNTTGAGVGHKLEAILNEDIENTIDLTNYFVGDLDSGGKSGLVKYNFTSLEQGDYNLKVKAWDVFNNFTLSETNFKVTAAGEEIIQDVYNYPNPFSSTTHFTFKHTLASAFDVKIKIYTINGRLIKEIDSPNIPASEKFVKIEWDGRDEDFDLAANGTYFYKLIVSTADGGRSENFLGKLAIIR